MKANKIKITDSLSGGDRVGDVYTHDYIIMFTHINTPEIKLYCRVLSDGCVI